MYYRKMWGKRIKNGDKKKMNRETTLKRPYAPCPKINQKNYEKNRKKVLTTEIECVILAKLSPRDRAKEPKKS